MISKVYCISVNWLDSTIIETEVDINKWMPSFTIVGLPDQWVQESKERLRSALKSSGAKLPTTKITVNLAPADIRKTWPSFDFPIAIWILLNEWYIKNEELVKESIFIWELSLNWDLRKVTSILPASIWAKEKGFKRIFLPKENAKEASIIPWIDIIAVENLEQAIDYLNQDKKLIVEKKLDFENIEEDKIETKYNFKYILWQSNAKRALEISASGGHNIIMDWPPGSGKTMLAKSFASILPDLDIEESIEISKLYSISWLLSEKEPIIRKRPFRTVHHTASSISIIGWWRNAKPWEISLAHKWILFLDEILEFPKNVLEVLRQPLEDWDITVTRVNASYNYPAKFSLVWAMNPCPCWYLTDPDKECICTANQIKNYRSKLSGPLIDRVDIFIEVPKVKTLDFKVWENYEEKESSEKIKKRVEKSRVFQKNRFKNSKILFNSEMSTKDINKYCKLDEDSDNLLKRAVNNMNLSARAYYRILKLARTIADLDQKENIEKSHIAEAISYRKKEEN